MADLTERTREESGRMDLRATRSIETHLIENYWVKQ